MLDWGLNMKLRYVRDQESNPQPLVYGVMLQPTEPPSQGWIDHILPIRSSLEDSWAVSTFLFL